MESRHRVQGLFPQPRAETCHPRLGRRWTDCGGCARFSFLSGSCEGRGEFLQHPRLWWPPCSVPGPLVPNKSEEGEGAQRNARGLGDGKGDASTSLTRPCTSLFQCSVPEAKGHWHLDAKVHWAAVSSLIMR